MPSQMVPTTGVFGQQTAALLTLLTPKDRAKALQEIAQANRDAIQRMNDAIEDIRQSASR
jgi:hypothetical protein